MHPKMAHGRLLPKVAEVARVQQGQKRFLQFELVGLAAAVQVGRRGLPSIERRVAAQWTAFRFLPQHSEVQMGQHERVGVP